MRKTKVTFVGLGFEQLGVGQLSSILKKDGFTVNLAYTASIFHDRFNLEIPSLAKWFNDDKYLLQQIEKQQPDILAFSTLTSTFQWMLGIARKAKEMNPKIKTVFGGVHVSAVPDLALSKPEVDYVVVGEGDIAFLKIARSIEQGRFDEIIENTRYKRPDGTVLRGLQKGFNQHLDELPFYDKILWEDHIRIQDIYITMASRGCPYRCTFCFNNFFAKLPEEKSGKYVRLRSPEHMLEELVLYKKRYDYRYVEFDDDIFTTSKVWLKEFLPKYKKQINRPFSALTHPRYMDDEIAKLIKESGGEWIQMGIQSMDESFKKDTLLRYERSDDISNALEAMNKYGINVKVDHMFGLPNEPITAQETAAKLYATHTPSRIQPFWTCYLPGTEMMTKAIEDGSLTSEQANNINEGKDFYFFRNIANVKDPELMKLYLQYEALFKFMPLIPSFLRRKISIDLIKKIPLSLLKPASFISEILIAFWKRNPDFSSYAKHNLYQILNFILRRIGFKGLRATPIIDATTKLNSMNLNVDLIQKPVTVS